MKEKQIKLKNIVTNKSALNDKTVAEIIIDNLPFSAWVKDEKGYFLGVNRAGADAAGKSKEEIIGKSDFELFPKDEADFFAKSDQLIIKNKSNQFFESEFNGIWYEEYKSAILDENGKVIGTSGFNRDITKRKKTEEALRESERRKAVLISNLPGVAYRCLNDENWTMTFLSEGCYDLTGYTPDEILRNKVISYHEIISSEHREITFKQWESDIAANLSSSNEYTIVTKSGEIKWVWDQSVIIYDKDGKPTESEGFIMDITQNKRNLAALNDREDRFRAIFDSAPIGIGIFGTKTGFIYQINAKFAEIIGRPIEELLTLDWKSYSHPDELDENIKQLKLLQNKKINRFTMNKRYIRPDGSIVWVKMNIVPFKEETNQDMHLCIIEDITEKKKREEEIQYLSYHDILTGLYNRTFFEEEKIRFNLSRKLPISIIMGDVNGLKKINDTLGHNKGDELLKEISEIIKKSCRGEDIVFRIGGDEFVILMVQTDEKAAIEVCKRIEKACEDYEKENTKEIIHMSISLGNATKVKDGKTIDELFDEAEKALYKKKNDDKGKIVFNL